MFDEKKELVLQFNKNKREWEDITTRVRRVEWVGNAYEIQYATSEIVYHKSRRDLTILKNPQTIDLNGKFIFINGKQETKISKILCFSNWYRVFFLNGCVRSFHENCIVIKKDLKESKEFTTIFEYLQSIAKLLSVEEGEDFLYSQLLQLNVWEDSALAKLLTKESNETRVNGPIITPFSINQSQKGAVLKALENNISIIQGPPGTGKTQTILNIIANYLYREKTIAVLSGNNEAIKNVYEKLEKEGYSYINATLGNKNNIEDFFDQPVKVPKTYIGYINTELKEKQLLQKESTRDKCLSYALKVAEIAQRIDEFNVEKRISNAEYNSKNHIVPKSLKKKQYDSKRILQLASFLEVLPNKKIKSLVNRSRLFFNFGIFKIKEIIKNQQDCIDYLKNNYYTQKIFELEEEKREKEEFLRENSAVEIEKEQKSISKELLDYSLQKRYLECQFSRFSKKTYKNQFREFTKRYPVVYSTTHAIRNCSNNSFLYDCIIIDESSQVDLVTAIIAFSCARRVVLVGDEKQLPHVVKSNMAKRMNTIFENYSLPKYWNYVTNNILKTINEMGINVPSTLLNEHYRCDPQIIGFCNKRFYNDQLVVHTKHKTADGVSIIKHGSHFCRGRTNERQIDIIDKEVLPNLDVEKVGIIAPYRAQVELLSERFKTTECQIDTVHKFQGKECDIVILSTVSNKVHFYEDDERVDFLNNPNLLNVAISRAKKRLYILASEEILNQEGSLMKDMYKYYEYYCNDTKICNTRIYSVFDLMYDDYTPILEETKKKLLNISEFQSENIIATIIREICESGKYGALDFKFNYPLRNIIKLQEIEDTDDKKFVMNPNTHCDFVIYSKLNKQIELVVEVDGSQHKMETQAKRDKRKDRLLTNAGVKILRLPTTAIECKEKIIRKLIDISDN